MRSNYLSMAVVLCGLLVTGCASAPLMERVTYEEYWKDGKAPDTNTLLTCTEYASVASPYAREKRTPDFLLFSRLYLSSDPKSSEATSAVSARLIKTRSIIPTIRRDTTIVLDVSLSTSIPFARHQPRFQSRRSFSDY